ncbi:MAG: electron transfer flavoprotein beta subunit/FixA family protein, partial [Deltaproteobacteria bacterium]|nr:electron transfer flavoprotein beta subunit/FixA family protein [Deltaproteobacteria bacterium]
ADEAYLAVDDKFAANTSLQNAVLLAALIRKIPDYGLILFGEGSGDNYSGQVAARTAGILGLPQVYYAVDLGLSEGKVKVTRALEDCVEVMEVELPAVVTVTAAINEPRIPSVMQILKAGKKPKRLFTVPDLGVDVPAAEISTSSNLAPEVERLCITVKSAGELVEKLRAEGLIGR